MSELTDEQKNNALGGCLVFLVYFLTIPFSAWWAGYVLLHLYNWFLLPIQGAPVVTIGNMLGVMLIIQYCTMYLMKWETNSESKPWTTILFTIIGKVYLVPALMLFFGWLYQRWFM
jgi:hypothetical protein